MKTLPFIVVFLAGMAIGALSLLFFFDPQTRLYGDDLISLEIQHDDHLENAVALLRKKMPSCTLIIDEKVKDHINDHYYGTCSFRASTGPALLAQWFDCDIYVSRKQPLIIFYQK